MDSGCIPEGDSFEPDFDVCGELDAGHVLWIMDELLQLEMSLHDGYPLSQNLFTSLHLFRLISPDNEYPYNFYYDEQSNVKNSLVHLVLRAYCIGVLKCCQLALQLIQDHTFYEEEDFVSYLFGRELLPKLKAPESRRLLAEAMDWVASIDLDSEMKLAISNRLVVREAMLHAFEGNDEHWFQLRRQIEGLKEDHHLCIAIPEAFSEKVQRQLATSTPPRPMPQVVWDDGIKKWVDLCEDVVAAHTLTSIDTIQSPHALQRATWAFAYRDPPPNTFVRAKLQDILTSDENVAGQITHFDLMLTDIRDLVLCGDPLADPTSFQIEVPTDVRHQTSRIVEEFMSRMFAEYLNIYRMVCQNRCRMRRTFTQAILLLDELETVARAADQDVNTIITPRRFINEAGVESTFSPLAAWTRHHKLQTIEWTIQLGFETDLYLPDEICNMYILLETNAQARQSHLHVLQQITIDRVRSRLSSTASPASRGEIDYIKSCGAWIGSMRLKAEVTRLLSVSLGSLYALLEHHGIIDTTVKPYEEARLRYDARMKPFLGMFNDQEPSLDDFDTRKKEMASALPSTIEAIISIIQETKKHLVALKKTSPAEGKYFGTEEQWKKEMKNLETVCVAITVTLSQVHRIWQSSRESARGGEKKSFKNLIEISIPPPGKRYHDWWVIPQIREVKK